MFVIRDHPEAREVLFGCDVAEPVDMGLDARMAPYCVGESLDRKRARGDVVTQM
jgi:hypothetical protein